VSVMADEDEVLEEAADRIAELLLKGEGFDWSEVGIYGNGVATEPLTIEVLNRAMEELWNAPLHYCGSAERPHVMFPRVAVCMNCGWSNVPMTTFPVWHEEES
jgi:hypothetical protein